MPLSRLRFLVDGDVFTVAANGSCPSLVNLLLLILKFVPIDVAAVRGCSWTFKLQAHPAMTFYPQSGVLPRPLMTTESKGRCPFSSEIAVSRRVSSTPMSTRT